MNTNFVEILSFREPNKIHFIKGIQKGNEIIKRNILNEGEFIEEKIIMITVIINGKWTNK